MLFRHFPNPHSAIRISSRLSPVVTALDLGLVSSSFGNFAIRNPQSAFPPHFLSPFARRHRSRSRPGFKLFRQFRNPQSAIRISSAFPLAFRPSSPLSISAWFQALSAISQSAIRNPHFLRISSRLSPVVTALDLGLVSSSFGNFAIRNPQSAFPPHFLSPFARRHRSRSRPGFKLFRPQSAIRNPHFLSPFARRHRSRSRPGF